MNRIKSKLDIDGNAIGQLDGVEVYRIHCRSIKVLQEKKDCADVYVSGLVFGACRSEIASSLEEAETKFTQLVVVWLARQLAIIHDAV